VEAAAEDDHREDEEHAKDRHPAQQTQHHWQPRRAVKDARVHAVSILVLTGLVGARPFRRVGLEGVCEDVDVRAARRVHIEHGAAHRRIREGLAYGRVELLCSVLGRSDDTEEHVAARQRNRGGERCTHPRACRADVRMPLVAQQDAAVEAHAERAVHGASKRVPQGRVARAALRAGVRLDKRVHVAHQMTLMPCDGTIRRALIALACMGTLRRARYARKLLESLLLTRGVYRGVSKDGRRHRQSVPHAAARLHERGRRGLLWRREAQQQW